MIKEEDDIQSGSDRRLSFVAGEGNQSGKMIKQGKTLRKDTADVGFPKIFLKQRIDTAIG